jgi:tRNA(Ile)-lysidine synthase
MQTLQQRVSAYIRSHSLPLAGDRVAVAVSGGADSVGLLRILLELRDELGIVLSVAHFHHGLRGQEADLDEAFVRELAKSFDLELHVERGDARQQSQKDGVSIETAARNLRYRFFLTLLESKRATHLATAHTLDDQAETVLMKVLRGAGSRGLSGIFPEQAFSAGSIVRPLLQVRRAELRQYLDGLSQSWREDLSNSDISFTRNRVRARVLPVIRELVNPAADIALSHLAEIAREEEKYWQEQLSRMLPLLTLPGQPARGGGRKQTGSSAISLDLQKLQQYPIAVRRRLLRAAAEEVGCSLDFEQVHQVLAQIAQRSLKGSQSKTVELTKGWRAQLLFREVRIEQSIGTAELHGYEHQLVIPGEVRIPELATTIRARISEDNGVPGNASYNRAHSICLPEVSEVVVRNWRAGDRFRPARHLSEKRVKELLYPLRLRPQEKQLWPVVAAGGTVLWVRGIESPELRTASGQRLCIEETVD